MAAEHQMTEKEMEELAQYMQGAAMPDQNQNVHQFLHNVATADDTTKVGYLQDHELGNPHLPLRTFKELSQFAGDVANMSFMSEYFKKRAETITSTSLSRHGFLINSAVTTRREMADVTKQSPEKKENKGLFNKKKGGDEQEQ